MIAALLFIALGDVKVDQEREIDRPLNIPTEAHLVVDHAQGDLIVFPVPPDGKAHAELKLSASGGNQNEEATYLDRFELGIEWDDDLRTLTVKTVFPPAASKPPDMSFAAQLRLWVPKLESLKLHGKYGPVKAHSLHTDLEVHNHLGPIEVEDIEGTVKLGTKHDRIVARRIKGPLTIETQSDRVEVTDIEGDVELTNQFGTVVLEGVRGTATIENRAGPIELRRIHRRTEVTAPYCDITAEEIHEELILRGNNAEVRVTDARGSVTIEHRHSTLLVDQVAGTLRVEGDFIPLVAKRIGEDVVVRATTSSVDLTDVKGAVDVETSTGATALRQIGGSIKAVGQGGLMEVHLQPTSGISDRTFQLENRASPLEIYIPEGAGCDLEVTSTIGRLDCEFPGLQIHGTGRAKTGLLTLGSGLLPVRATAIGGLIRIRRANADQNSDEEEE